MELNINCDLGEKSEVFDGINDYELLKIINTANIACGYHAGSKEIIQETIINAKKFGVSIGAHPGFDDKLNFGRKKFLRSNRSQGANPRSKVKGQGHSLYVEGHIEPFIMSQVASRYDNLLRSYGHKCDFRFSVTLTLTFDLLRPKKNHL